MKHVLVTRGAYRDRTILMDDGIADAAVADGWAVDPAEQAERNAERAERDMKREKDRAEARERGDEANDVFYEDTDEAEADAREQAEQQSAEPPQSLIDFEAAVNRGLTSLDPPGSGDGGDGGDGGIGEGGEGEGGEGGGTPEPGAPPVLSSLDPNTAVLGSEMVTMHCYGSGFTPESVITFAGQPEPIVFISENDITTGVTPTLGWGPNTPLPVTVSNGDAVSNSLDFTFTEPV
jgi:hypothetical protein